VLCKPSTAQISLADLNLHKDDHTDLLFLSETVHDANLAALADRVVSSSATVVVVAGPSSSGKTTFTHRLRMHLRARGKAAQLIECDDYYRARTDPMHPRDANGELNFEDADALQLERLAQDVAAILRGDIVDLPHFNFKDGTSCAASGRLVSLPVGGILMLEGIFGLHPKFLRQVDAGFFRVLIGPWSGVHIGDLFVIPERMLRLLRRIGRDTAHRGVTATQVVHKFSSVSNGERINIFEHASQADAVFDSALFYELSALKPHIKAGLDSAGGTPEEQAIVAQLQSIVAWIEGWSSVQVPRTSILMVFVGKSIFG